mmetsp:Transcript_4733/g.10573  ORF Transcript_4733/g.10573 Transcript_4733/m.10573 type:complete len:257 (-) Transcript_4733:509-1279(-)
MPGPKPHLSKVEGEPSPRRVSVAVGTRMSPSFPSESDEAAEGEMRGVRWCRASIVGTPDSWPAPSPGPVGDSEKMVLPKPSSPPSTFLYVLTVPLLSTLAMSACGSYRSTLVSSGVPLRWTSRNIPAVATRNAGKVYFLAKRSARASIGLTPSPSAALAASIVDAAAAVSAHLTLLLPPPSSSSSLASRSERLAYCPSVPAMKDGMPPTPEDPPPRPSSPPDEPLVPDVREVRIDRLGRSRDDEDDMVSRRLPIYG